MDAAETARDVAPLRCPKCGRAGDTTRRKLRLIGPLFRTIACSECGRLSTVHGWLWFNLGPGERLRHVEGSDR